eukprot:6309724-Prymnesium_polylepis.1
MLHRAVLGSIPDGLHASQMVAPDAVLREPDGHGMQLSLRPNSSLNIEVRQTLSPEFEGRALTTGSSSRSRRRPERH